MVSKSRWEDFKASMKPRMKEWRFILKKTSENPLSVTGIVILVGFVIIAVAAPILAPPAPGQDPFQIPKDLRLFNIGIVDPIPPTYEHPFGTIEEQYDLYYACIWGTITAFRVGILVVVGALAIGLVIGITAAYYGGVVDEILMRFTDIVIAFPGLVLAMALVIALPTVWEINLSLFFMTFLGLLTLAMLTLRARHILSITSALAFLVLTLSYLYFPWKITLALNNLDKVLMALTIVGWPSYARVVRGEVFRVKSEDYIEAAKASGCSDLRIIVKHVIPNAIYPVLIMASLDTGSIVLAAAALSFLGLGAEAGYADWGQVIQRSQHWIGVTNVPLTEYMHAFLVPGFFIFMFVLAWNLLGDAVRDILDPMLRRR